MALINCSECGKEVSTKAEACPHCGAKQPQSTLVGSIVGVALILIGALVVLVVIIGLVVPEQSKEARMPVEAKLQCRAAITSLLRSPRSAHFNDDDATSPSKGVYQVRGTVDAQNAFGAEVRSAFGCDYEADASGSLKLKRACIDGLVPCR